MLYHLNDFSQIITKNINTSLQKFQSFIHTIPYSSTYPASGMLYSISRYLSFVTSNFDAPDWEIETVIDNSLPIPISIETVLSTPFMDLIHFKREDKRNTSNAKLPKILLCSPMSGHFPTLLRGTVKTMLPNHDVYITDWKSAKHIPVSAGRFGLDEYIEHICFSLEALKADCHVIAVCQPVPLVLAAASVIAEGKGELKNKLKSIILIGGPVDSENPNSDVTNFAKSKSIEYFKQNMICRIPSGYDGVGRNVYPGFMQLSAFIAMNSNKHNNAYGDYFQKLIEGDEVAASKHEQFYKEYLSVADTCSEFYIETIENIFQKNLLPKNKFKFKGKTVTLEKIINPTLLVIEGELDDITAPGQTKAALDLCKGIAKNNKYAYLAKGVGHYGVFNGSKFRKNIYPIIKDCIAKSN